MSGGQFFPSPTHALKLGTAPSDAGTIHSDVDPGPVGPRRIWQESDGTTWIRTDDNTAWVGVAGAAPATPDLTTVLTAGNDAGALAITDLADPTDPQDAATKAYVDGLPPPTVTSPLTGAADGSAGGGSVAFGDAPDGNTGGDATLKGGAGNSDLGATVVAKGGASSGIGGQLQLSSGLNNNSSIVLASNGAGITISGNIKQAGDTGAWSISSSQEAGGAGAPIAILAADGTSGHTGGSATLRAGDSDSGGAGNALLKAGDATGGGGLGAELLVQGGSGATNGQIFIVNPLPTSDPGEPGALYQVAGVVMISL